MAEHFQQRVLDGPGVAELPRYVRLVDKDEQQQDLPMRRETSPSQTNVISKDLVMSRSAAVRRWRCATPVRTLTTIYTLSSNTISLFMGFSVVA